MRFSFVWFFVIAAVVGTAGAESTRDIQLEKSVYVYIDPFVDTVTYDTFSVQCLRSLNQALSQMQLYAVKLDSFGMKLPLAGRGSVPILYVTVGESEESWRSVEQGGGVDERMVEIIVSMLDSPQPSPKKIALAVEHPLVTMLWSEGDSFSFISIMSRKVAENLRTGFLSSLVIESIPADVRVWSSDGLQGTTPVEWVFTPTKVHIEARKKGYLQYSTNIDILNPGNHRLHIQLTKRRFYHSKLIYGALGFGLMALGSYGACTYYYDRYRSLGEADFYSRPENFSDTFNRARQFERAAGVCLGVASCLFALSFRF